MQLTIQLGVDVRIHGEAPDPANHVSILPMIPCWAAAAPKSLRRARADLALRGREAL
jgi:hypothetical protein